MKMLANKKSVVLIAMWLFLAVGNCVAQGPQHYNSPLYSPKSYEDDTKAVSSNGMPSVLKKVGIEQKLGSQLPLDAKFIDENGQEVEFGKYFNGNPVVLALVYYECPMLCNEVLNGLNGGLRGMSFNAGKEFDVVAISFDPRERPEIAKAKKENFVARYSRPDTANGIHLLTGSQESIDRVAKAVGFNYEWDEKTKQFAHAGGIMIATPEGQLSHYFYGIEYAPKEIRLGLIEASNNKIGNPVDQLMLYCYHYDPSTGTYGLLIMRALRIAGAITLVGLVSMIFVLWRFRSNNNSAGNEEAA